MASIVKRKQKYAVVYYSRKEDGKRHQIWETFSDRETAERRKNQIEYLQRYGVDQAPDIITVEDLLREYVSVYGVNNWAMSTYSNKQGLIENYIIPTIGHVKLTDLNTMNMDSRRVFYGTKSMPGPHTFSCHAFRICLYDAIRRDTRASVERCTYQSER